jgi:hypothetical protein
MLIGLHLDSRKTEWSRSRLMQFRSLLPCFLYMHFHILHSVSASIQINLVHLSNEIATKIHMI